MRKVKPLKDMTKRELLAWAEEQGFQLSSTTRLRRGLLENHVRYLMQKRNREHAEKENG